MPSIRQQIRTIPVGKTEEFPIEQMRTVRTHASELSLMMDRKYSTKTDRENRKIYVTRDR